MSNKRIKLAETLRAHTPRKILLALESGVPEEVGWALHALLVISAPPNEAAPIDRLADTLSLVRNPVLLRALLPVAVPPQPGKGSDAALYPCPPASVHTRALGMAQCRQAWLVLRNMSFVPENEAPLAASEPLRRLLLNTLRRAFLAHEDEPALTASDLASPESPDGPRSAASELPVAASAQPDAAGQCALSAFCVRGFRHGGRGGPCRLVQPPSSMGQASSSGQKQPQAATPAAPSLPPPPPTPNGTLGGAAGSPSSCAPPRPPGPGPPTGGQQAATPPPPSVASSSALEAVVSAGAESAGAVSAGAVSAGGELRQGGMLPPPPPLLSPLFDTGLHVAAAELLSNLCRIIRLDDVRRPPHSACWLVPRTTPLPPLLPRTTPLPHRLPSQP